MLRVASFALLLLLPALAPAGAIAAEAPDVSFDELLRQANAARQAGQFERAVELLQAAHTMHPSPELLNNIGLMLEKAGRYRDAADAYRRVAEDASADPNLRALDAGRLATLQPRLGMAWVKATLVPTATVLRVDGRPPNAPPGQSFSVDGGDHLFELTLPGGSEVVLLRRTFPLDRLTSLDVTAQTTQGFGRVTLGGLGAPASSIVIDGYRIASPLDRLQSIRLAPGRYAVRIERLGAPALEQRVVVAAGRSFEPRPTAVKAKAPALPDVDAVDPGPAVSPAAWILLGVGVAVAAGGGILYALGQQDLDEVSGAARDAQGRITGMTYTQASEQVDNGRRKKDIGLGMLIGGGAVAVGGSVWALVQAARGPSERESVQVGVGAGGVVVSGSF